MEATVSLYGTTYKVSECPQELKDRLREENENLYFFIFEPDKYVENGTNQG